MIEATTIGSIHSTALEVAAGQQLVILIQLESSGSTGLLST
jgi:hypothetical protein